NVASEEATTNVEMRWLALNTCKIEPHRFMRPPDILGIGPRWKTHAAQAVENRRKNSHRAIDVVNSRWVLLAKLRRRGPRSRDETG
ncbi:MAG TPA: hypothetical protein VJT08_19215, partial [Terriglobales bacterium]|nr:hypothetical protein [Terriglobales bacterium]